MNEATAAVSVAALLDRHRSDPIRKGHCAWCCYCGSTASDCWPCDARLLATALQRAEAALVREIREKNQSTVLASALDLAVAQKDKLWIRLGEVERERNGLREALQRAEQRAAALEPPLAALRESYLRSSVEYGFLPDPQLLDLARETLAESTTEASHE